VVVTTREQRLRVRVDPLEEAIFDLGPGDFAADDAGRRRLQVRPLPQTSADKAAGIHRFETTIDGWVLEVSAESQDRALLRERAGQGSASGPRHGSDQIRAQIPGRVVRLWVSPGDTVEAGQRLLAIEAMKMENEVRAPHAGTVEVILVAVDSSVELGDELLTVR
jgi:biotin carboxyl carrier protein